MRAKVLLLVLLLFLFGMGGNTWGQGMYKWVDEKGTIHFSESPVSTTPKNQDQSQGKTQGKTQDKNQVKAQAKDEVRAHAKNEVRAPDKNQEKKLDKPVVEKESGAVLKRLEFGNRYIPKDMRKYGPAGPAGPERRDQGGEQVTSSSSAKTGRS